MLWFQLFLVLFSNISRIRFLHPFYFTKDSSHVTNQKERVSNKNVKSSVTFFPFSINVFTTSGNTKRSIVVTVIAIHVKTTERFIAAVSTECKRLWFICSVKYSDSRKVAVQTTQYTVHMTWGSKDWFTIGILIQSLRIRWNFVLNFE